MKTEHVTSVNNLLTSIIETAGRLQRLHAKAPLDLPDTLDYLKEADGALDELAEVIEEDLADEDRNADPIPQASPA